ncbi:MAG: c-type cytochrome [Gammaproteobacteria bacterium]
MKRKQPLKPGEKIMFSVFAAFLVLAVVGYVIMETVRSHATEPMFASLTSFEFSPQGLRGSVTFREVGCTSCHRAMRNGTNNGLSLDGIGSRRSPEWINSFLKNPEATFEARTVDHGFGPGKEAAYVQSMPDKDLDDISVFLSELKAQQGSAASKLPPIEKSGFIDSMVNMWAPEAWKGKYEDIRVKIKREQEQKAAGNE